MAEPLVIYSSPYPAPGLWGKESLVSFTDTSATIHVPYKTEHPLRLVQRAGKQLSALGIPSADCQGEHWSLDKLWAFFRGFHCNSRRPECRMPALDKDEADRLRHRCAVIPQVKQWIDEPADTITPLALCHAIIKWLQAIDKNAISWQLISGEEIKKHGWMGLHHVGRGSQQPPAMLEVDFNPTGDNKAPTQTVLVGKGITFDSGGYSLKGADPMSHMKLDMAGAATIAGALGLAMLNGHKRRVRLIVCAAENMVSGHALRLGDRIEYKNGVNVEVKNTDAEGRLVLADGLLRACEYDPEMVIDAATLTGAALNAVGPEHAAFMGVNQELCQRFKQVADDHNDLVWQLPLQSWHREQFPSSLPDADTANSIAKPGGGMSAASGAAGFLSRFVNFPERWLHLDLANAFHFTDSAHWAAGATGNSVLALAALLTGKHI